MRTAVAFTACLLAFAGQVTAARHLLQDSCANPDPASCYSWNNDLFECATSEGTIVGAVVGDKVESYMMSAPILCTLEANGKPTADCLATVDGLTNVVPEVKEYAKTFLDMSCFLGDESSVCKAPRRCKKSWNTVAFNCDASKETEFSCTRTTPLGGNEAVSCMFTTTAKCPVVEGKASCAGANTHMEAGLAGRVATLVEALCPSPEALNATLVEDSSLVENVTSADPLCPKPEIFSYCSGWTGLSFGCSLPQGYLSGVAMPADEDSAATEGSAAFAFRTSPMTCLLETNGKMAAYCAEYIMMNFPEIPADIKEDMLTFVGKWEARETPAPALCRDQWSADAFSCTKKNGWGIDCVTGTPYKGQPTVVCTLGYPVAEAPVVDGQVVVENSTFAALPALVAERAAYTAARMCPGNDTVLPTPSPVVPSPSPVVPSPSPEVPPPSPVVPPPSPVVTPSPELPPSPAVPVGPDPSDCAARGLPPNTGSGNTGCGNTGNNNVGDFNIGSNNIGSKNTGSSNRGDCNIGSSNTGNGNVMSGVNGDGPNVNCEPPAS